MAGVTYMAVTVPGSSEDGRVAEWNPWRELRHREAIVFGFADLPTATGGAVLARRGDRVAIVIDRSLSRVERKAALAHELVHDERGGGAARVGMPSAWGPVVARDEAAVEQEVARRLVPPARLAVMLQARADAGVDLSVDDIADEFDVPEPVALRALQMLEQ